MKPGTRAPVYSIGLVHRARELREAEWPLRKIADLVEKETGHRPSTQTIHRWVSETEASKHAARGRARHRRESAAGAGQGGRLGQRQHSPLYQEARARALVSEGGMRVTQAALVMAFDYPDAHWSVRRLRYLLERDGKAAA